MIKSDRLSQPRIVHVSPAYFDPESVIGGGERYAVELAVAVNRLIPTKLVTFGPHRQSLTIKGLPIEVYRPPFLLDGSKVNPVSLAFLHELRDARIIHCHQYWTAMTNICQLYALATRKRVFATDLGFRGRNFSHWIKGGRLTAGFLLISFFSAQFYRRYAAKTRVIYGGIDETVFRPMPVPKERRVLFVGRYLPHKGIDDLINAVDEDTELHIVGRPFDTLYFSYLKMLAIGKKVTFKTDLPDDELPAEYSRAAVTVLPSVYKGYAGEHYEQPELLGLTLLESMACETPVICTKVGAMPEVVRDGMTGYVVPPNDPKALGEKLRMLLDHPDKAAAMGQRGRAIVLSHFTWASTAERCVQAYNELGGL